jgi:Trp operon repressor
METLTKYLQTQEETNQLLRNLIIVELCLAGVGQREIRSIVGGNMGTINRLVRLVRKNAKGDTKK